MSSNFSLWRKDILANYLNARLQALVQHQPSRLVTWSHNVFALKSAKSKSLLGDNLLGKEVNCLVQQSPPFSVGGKKLLHRSNTAPLPLFMTGGKEQHSNRAKVVRKLIMHFQHLKLFWRFMTKMFCMTDQDKVGLSYNSYNTSSKDAVVLFFDTPQHFWSMWKSLMHNLCLGYLQQT